MAQWRTTTYTEYEPQSPRGSLRVDGRNSLERRVSMSWAALGTGPHDFLGGPRVVEAKSGATLYRYISRLTPHAYPKRFSPWYPSTDMLHCTSFDFVTQGEPSHDATVPTNPVGRAAVLEVTLGYESVLYDVKEDSFVRNTTDPFPHEGTAFPTTRYVTRFWRPGGKIQTFGNGMFKYVPSGDPLKEGFPVNIGSAEVVLVWHQVPLNGIPTGVINSTLGTVNSVDFGPYTAETLQLLSVDVREYWHPLGVRVADVTYRLFWQPNISPVDGLAKGQNYIYRVVGGAVSLQLVTDNGMVGGGRPLRQKPFAALFRPDPP